IWQIPQLEAGTADSITVTVQLAPNVPPELQLLITKVDLFAANDNSPGNNSATDTVRVVFPAVPSQYTDITVSQFALTDSFAVVGRDTLRYARRGETYQYILTVKNISAVAAQNITVTDFLPDSVRAKDFQPLPNSITGRSIRWLISTLPSHSSVQLKLSGTVSTQMPVGINLLINKVEARADNEDPSRLADNTAIDTVYNVVKASVVVMPLIEARPPVVAVGDSIFVRVQVLTDIKWWDLWVYFADGRVDTTFADTYIKSNPLTPKVWYEVSPAFTKTRLYTTARQELIRFEIRTRDVFGNLASASAVVEVRSSNDLVLDRNTFRADTETALGIKFKLSSNRVARLEVFDLNGICVTELIEDFFNAGWNTYYWNGLTKEGRKVGSGVYIIALRSGEYNAWKKCIIVR
ncbi:MAG: hypothetical protein ONB45_19795, partial [candidate division KSB1 bacterium]|nr:hypothetical protein [candidate division KSB1 bacterium]